jgi:hypothetical protein
MSCTGCSRLKAAFTGRCAISFGTPSSIPALIDAWFVYI